MTDFNSLIETDFDGLIDQEPIPGDPPGFKPETTQVTSSLGDPLGVIPIQKQIQGETAQKYGMDFDPNMYMPDNMPDLTTTPEEKPVEEVHEQAHHEYHESAEARKAMDQMQTKQANIYQTKKKDVRIDPDLLKPRTFEKGGAAEYLVDKLSNESLVGKASILLTGTLQAALQGGDPVEYYRDIYDANNKTIMGYKPSGLQETATGMLAIFADLPVFTGVGTIYNSAANASIKMAVQQTSDQLVRAGSTRVLADMYAKNSVMNLNTMLQTGTVLGTHSGLNDIATQLADGAELGDINWDQALKTGNKSFVIGGALGAWGVGTNYIKNSPHYQKMVDGSIRGRLIEKGIMSASFGGEISIFTYGEALLDGERRWHDVSGKEFFDATAVILGLKAMHSRARLPKGRGMFNATELDAIKKHTKTGKDPIQSLIENEGSLEKIFEDKKTPYSLKAKIANAAGVEVPMPVVDNVRRVELPGGGVKVETVAGKTIVQSETFASPADAHRFFNDVETGISDMRKAGEMAKLKPENQTELDRRLEKAGIEGGVANQEMLEAVQQLPSMRTTKQRSMANKAFETYENFKVEKETVEDGKPAEDIFMEKAPEVEPEPVTAREVSESLKPFTIEQIELKFEANDRLQTKIAHPREGIDKMLGDLQAIKESGVYTNTELNSKTIRNYFPDVAAETLRMNSKAEVLAAEKKLQSTKAGIEKELARRTEAGEPAVGEGAFVLGRQGFETKEQLFRELDKFPGLENTLPEVFDFETMKAIQEYENLTKQAKELKPKPTGEKTAEQLKATAEKIRGLKGTIGPKPGELGISILPPQVIDTALEIAARSFETTGDAVAAVGRAIDSIKTTTAYQGLSAIEKKRIERELLTRLNATFDIARPPKTKEQKKIDKGQKRPINKVTVNEYTALKDQLKVQAKSAKDIDKFRKEAQADIQKFIGTKEFQTNMGARTSKTIARKVAGMDVNNPGSVVEVMDYIDRAIKDAKFREELVEIDKSYDKLDKMTAPESYQKKEGGIQKGKSVPPETQDKLKVIREDMVAKDWKEGQKEIDKLQEEIGTMNPGDPLIDQHLDMIEELSFHGLMNETSRASLNYLNSKVKDIAAIRKSGRTVDAARRMIRAAEKAERTQGTFDVLNAGKKNVVLDPEKAANLKVPLYDKISRNLDWTSTDSWFTFLDKLSKYDKGSTPMRSFISKTFGDSWIRGEQAEAVSKSAQLEKVQTKAREVYGVESKDALDKILKKNTTDIHTMKWDAKDIQGKTTPETLDITMNQAYKRWMELQDPTLKPSLTKQGYFDQFGERTAKYDALEGVLSPEAKKWAEWQLNEFMPEYWKTINPVYREIYGTDMPYHDKYSPIFVADKLLHSDAAIDHMMNSMDFRGMAGNNHLKLRTGHAKELLLLDGDQVLMSYIDKMEFFKAWSNNLKEMNSTFTDRGVRESIRQNFGPNHLSTLDLYLDDFARKPKNISQFEKIANKIRVNFTIGSLAFKPTVFLKQLTSFPAYADNIPVSSFMKGLADFAVNPKKVLETLNESVYLKERYSKGWDRDISLAMQRDARSMVSGKNLKAVNTYMFLTKYGDKAAIIVGGWPVYKYHYDKSIADGLSVREAESIAMKEFEFASRNSQQATGTADLSAVQRHNIAFKWLTMYKTSPLQYHRKVMGATRNLVHGRGSAAENIKTLAIYHVLLPQLFQMASNGFKWDGEDQAWALALGNFNNVFAAGDAMQGLVNHIREFPFDYSITPVESLITDSYKAYDEIIDLPKIIEDLPNTSIDEVLDAIDKLGKVAGHWTGTPVHSVLNTMSGINDAVQGTTDYPMRRVLGYSEGALKEGTELWELPDLWKKNHLEGMNNEKKSFDQLLEDNKNPKSFDDLIE